MRQPPVLLVSLPRSGSTWIGEALGDAPEAAYLFEPATQSGIRLGLFGDGRTVTQYVPPEAPPETYCTILQTAFLGLPVFPARIVRRPEQWSLGDRTDRRLIIKEVNPLCLEWVIGRFRPKILFLVRHPAGVALSRHRLGWETIGPEQDHAYHPELLARYSEADRMLTEIDDFWDAEGLRQGLFTRYALDCLRNYPDARIVHYENVCREPRKMFESLYDFCGLTMTDTVRERIESRSSGGASATGRSEKDAYKTNRDSRAMRESWRTEIEPETLTRLMTLYARFETNLYAEPTPRPADRERPDDRISVKAQARRRR